MRHFRPSKFSDKNVEEAEGWLIKLEYHFMIKGYGPNTRFIMVALHLVESTSKWWHSYLVNSNK